MKEEKIKDKEVAGALCNDKDCPFHGRLKARGKIFEGKVKKKFPRRIVVEFEKEVYIRKYERYKKRTTRIHARLPDCIKEKVQVGDIVQVQECRPLSKIIHFVVIKTSKKKK